MAELISSQPLLPLPPAGLDMAHPTTRYLLNLVESLTQELIFLRTHLNERTLIGTAATKPLANGSRRFFWHTDGTPHMEFDNGTWASI